MSTGNSARAEAIAAYLLAGHKEKIGDLINEFLKEIYLGVRVEQINPLLLSGDDEIAGEAAWALSELGARAREVMRQCPFLIDHRAAQVRRHFSTVVWEAATIDDAQLIGRTISHLDDPANGVRLSAIFFSARIDSERLRAGILSDGFHEEWREHFSQLLDKPDPSSIGARLTDEDKAVRGFAAAVAFRVEQQEREQLLELATKSEDAEVRCFGNRALEMLKRPPRARRRPSQ